MRKQTLAAGVVLLSLSFSISAQDGFYASGLGVSSCGQFVMAMEKHRPTMLMTRSDGESFHTRAAAYREWTQGFLAAYSAMEPADRRRLPAEINGVMVWLREYCIKYPTVSFAWAVHAYVNPTDN